MEKYKHYLKMDVNLSNKSYPIYLGKGILSDVNFLNKLVPASQVLIVTNNIVAAIYLETIKKAFSNKQCDVVILPDGEEHKNQQNLLLIYDALIMGKHNRDTVIIALGGGVIGDIAGFGAATYQRGVKLIQVPTTLMAKVDSSVGGKTAINYLYMKNMIGSFYQPDCVLMDLNTLSTLPKREFNAGIGEMIKYALLFGGEYLTKLKCALEAGLTAENPNLAALIADSCRIKMSFVVPDEKEAGIRALLNLGHTFAHALENYTKFNRFLHGEAVAIGLYCAALLSYKLGFATIELVNLVDSLLTCAKLDKKIPADICIESLYELFFLDKKVRNKDICMVLIQNPGNCFVEKKIKKEILLATLSEALDN